MIFANEYARIIIVVRGVLTDNRVVDIIAANASFAVVAAVTIIISYIYIQVLRYYLFKLDKIIDNGNKELFFF